MTALRVFQLCRDVLAKAARPSAHCVQGAPGYSSNQAHTDASGTLACLQITLAALVNPLAQAGTQAPRYLTSSRPAKPVPTDLVVLLRRTVAARGGS